MNIKMDLLNIGNELPAGVSRQGMYHRPARDG